MNNTATNTATNKTTEKTEGNGILKWIIIIGIGFFIYQTLFGNNVSGTTWVSKTFIKDGYETQVDGMVNFYFDKDGQMRIHNRFGEIQGVYHQDGKKISVDCMGESVEGTVKGSKMVLYEGDNKLIMKKL